MFNKIKTILTAYTKGIWFLLSDPITFSKFVEVYFLHKQDLDRVDAAREAGYFELNRKTRRKLQRQVR